jgi:hypothetical protein
MYTYPIILYYILLSSFIFNFYSTFIILFLLTSPFHGNVPVSRLMLYNTEIVQRGFTDPVAFEELIFTFDEGLLGSDYCYGVVSYKASHADATTF